jgi:hypothetical protein
MSSYHQFTRPGCEEHFRLVWPNPIPNHLHLSSKITIKCPACKEQTELYAFLLDKILQAPEPGIPTVQPELISPRDLNPDPDARSKWQQQIFIRRAQRFRMMYGN